MVVRLLQGWIAFVVVIMLIYAVRHWIFTWSRLMGKQRPFYQDLYDNTLPPISIIVPMHNEGLVACTVLDALLASNYPRELLEIIPVDDQSHDDTTIILHQYHERYPFIQPLYMLQGERGKAEALNTALQIAKHEIVLVFDADYSPGAGLLRELSMAFVDPEVGAVMGRVVPRNTAQNLLTRLLSLERSGGYQVDQQARYNLDLFPQYGGTVGGFRRSVVLDLGGFDSETLAEDTDLTARLFTKGWKIYYANRAECYEEVPDSWEGRFTQLRRWSRGHNRALAKNLIGLLRSPLVNASQKLDGTLLLGVYAIPPLLMSGLAVNTLLFLMGAIPVWAGVLFSFFVVVYSAFGNFGPIYEIGAAEVLDGSTGRLFLLPYLFSLFLFNSWAVTSGVLDTIGDGVKNRTATWDKTQRSEESEPVDRALIS